MEKARDIAKEVIAEESDRCLRYGSISLEILISEKLRQKMLC